MKNLSRRDFLRKAAVASGGCVTILLLGPGGGGDVSASSGGESPLLAKYGYDWEDFEYAYLVDTTKCIGCGMCVKACKAENKVPDNYYRTWVEKYEVGEAGEGKVSSPNGALEGFKEGAHGSSEKAFFVPKICNHCEKPPCVQVCPVGATYRTHDGVVLVDPKHCVGCGYCVQACPYGARFLPHDKDVPFSRTAQKCTLCYHRLVRDPGRVEEGGKALSTACIEACPVGARKLANMKDKLDEIREIIRTRRVAVLQPELLTEPQCFYLGLDKEVR